MRWPPGKSRLENPKVATFSWLDLAPGLGQLIQHAERELTPGCCRKVHYVGIDIEQDYVREVERLARPHFAKVTTYVSTLHDFSAKLGPEDMFDAISITNTLHEITPASLPLIVTSTLCRLKRDGFLFLYDMEHLPKPELGAVPWRGPEFEAIVRAMLESCNEQQYRPSASVWPHHSTTGWHMTLDRNYIAIDSLAESGTAMINAGSRKIVELLRKKLQDAGTALEQLCEFGADPSEEDADEITLLYDFHACTRALSSVEPVVAL